MEFLRFWKTMQTVSILKNLRSTLKHNETVGWDPKDAFSKRKRRNGFHTITSSAERLQETVKRPSNVSLSFNGRQNTFYVIRLF